MKKIIKHFAEAVGIGHPDKICDQISDAILDKAIEIDPNSRVAIEVMASSRLITISGEMTTHSYIDVVKVAWKILSNLGYGENDFIITTNINSQSLEIEKQVNYSNDVIKAGDQGIVFGYATNETKQLMPLPITIAQELIKGVEKLIRSKLLMPTNYDMKSEVIINEFENKFELEKVILSIQHHKDQNLDEMRKIINSYVVKKVISKNFENSDYIISINHGNQFSFVKGGPLADTGLTGRKLIVDTYGTASRHGGGSFSGKDYTKVDRTGAYLARYIAKNIVASKLANRVEVMLAYEISNAKPIGIELELFGTEKIAKSKIIKIIKNTFALNLSDVVNKFNLRKNKYQDTSIYGHFGRDDLDLPWEKLDQVEALKKHLT